jgi:3-hydroxypropanoate dehydrogenase
MLIVQPSVTDTALPTVDLTELEDDLSGGLAIDGYTQDLLFRRARTPRGFIDAPVSEETMRAVYDLIKWGPTSRNGQPLRIVLVRSPEARERLVRHMSAGNQARTLSAPLVAVLAVDAGSDGPEPEDPARINAARNSALLQSGYFIIGVRAAGLAAGPMEGFDAAGIDHEFFGDGRHRTVLVINLGYPAPDAYRPRQPRLDYDEVISTV